MKIFITIENFCVRQVKNIIFIATSIAFLLVVGTSVYIGVKSISTPDDIKVADAGQLSSYRSKLQKEHELKYKKNTTVDKSKEIEQKKNSDPIDLSIKNIFNNLNSYAEILGDEPITSEIKLKKDLLESVERVVEYDSQYVDVLRDLELETKQLIALGEELKVMPITDSRRIDMRSFVPWFFSERLKAKQDADKKTKAELEKVRNDKIVAGSLIPILGIMAIVFAGLLAFLVYMRIDLGIRLISKYIADDKDSKEGKNTSNEI